ncbi:MAG: hypothetical protein GMKNLPBB_00694 [Myxococcota bacterium]|nr:hypothetical protein [Myxococcota bacterium]
MALDFRMLSRAAAMVCCLWAGWTPASARAQSAASPGVSAAPATGANLHLPLSHFVQEGQYQLTATLARQEAELEDPVGFEVLITHPRGVVLRLADNQKMPEGLRMRTGEGGPVEASNGTQHRFQMEFSLTDVADATIPPVEFVDGGGQVVIRTNETPLRFRPTLPPDQDPAAIEAQPVTEMESIPRRDFRRLYWLLGSLGALLLAGLILWRARNRKPAPAPAPPPIRPPHEVAMERLEAIMRKRHLAAGRVKEHYFEVTEVLREYLGRRYGFYSMDMTTGELLRELQLKRTHALDLVALEKFLHHADLVKFSTYQPTPGESGSVLDAAFHFVEATAQRAQPPAAASSAARAIAAAESGGEKDAAP